MQAASEPSVEQWLLKGRGLFLEVPIPARETLVDRALPVGIELEAILCGKKWSELAVSDHYVLSSAGIDLSDVFASLSKIGIRYYLPGFLIHFFRNGNYRNNISGPDFYFSFIRRLQCDSARVRRVGGCQEYFNLSKEQQDFCGDLMWEIYLRHGDPYEKFVDRGYEYLDLAQCSIARALVEYWKRDY